MSVSTSPDIERAMEYAEYVLAGSEQSPINFVKPSSGSSNKSKSIHQKLMDLYIEETMREPVNENLVYASNLLAKLAKRERLNCMVLSLYPGNEGYSIMLRSRSGVESETMKLPYEESEILEFVDAAQLPPFLLDLLEKAQMNVFYSGCVVVEIRDYRRSATGSHDTQYVLLRPSAQSILRDIRAMSCDGQVWSQDDLHCLESELLLATEEPLCLDPSPAVMFVENALQYRDKLFNDPGLKRSVKKHTQAALNRKRKLAQSSAPKSMRLHDFLARRREKAKSSTAPGINKARQVIDRFKKTSQPPTLPMPESIDVKKYAKLPDTSASDGMIFVEEHTLERDLAQERHMMARITIYQPQLADNYIGDFYLDHDYMQGRTGEEGRRCRFVSGSRQCVDRYLQQFIDLFTEKGKLQVKISIQKANEATPTVYYTQGVAPVAATVSTPSQTPSPAQSALAISNAQALMKQVAAAGQQNAASQQQQQTGQIVGKAGDVSGMVASLAAKRNIPIQLSLSISPASSLAGSSHGLVAGAGLPSSLSAQFIASSIQSGSIMTAQRIKVPASVSSQLRPNSSSMTSSTSTAKSPGASLIAIPKAVTSTPTPTPPPSARAPTPTSGGVSRRASATELSQHLISATGQQQQQQQQQHVQQNLQSFLQGLTSGTTQNASGDAQSSLSQQQQQQSGGITNISIGNLSNLPPNINIQGLTGLPGVNITNLSGLQQMQIAVPVPITMINNNPSLLQTQSGLLGTSSTTTGSGATTYVTMVTALQATSTTCSTTSSTTVAISPQVPTSSGQTSNSAPTLLPQGSTGMLSFPVGLSGLTQLMPVNSKTQSGQGIRAPTGVPLLQLQGQQGPIQLLSLQQQRGGQVKAAGLVSASQGGQAGVARLTAQGGTTSAVPLSTVLTSQQMTALGVGGKPGQAGGGAPITAQQLLQLTGGAAPTALGQAGTHVAFQKAPGAGGVGQTLQFHQLHLKPGTATLGQGQGIAGKGKGKKRTTPTPPK
ncbi:transcription factor SPT20 homolog [Elysia marginata]|uniref:Transcription factor SPT20 homolog n=1 Tax=Elysia marginata TaxID=1093978 RepID=A0AAV4IRR8_9GAST|nr:transcription factor SPT20 homolog [Elysia marginata]